MTGIITKVDAVKDPETADSLLKILYNKTLPLEKGYIGVINKSKFQVPSSYFDRGSLDRISLDRIS